MKNLFIAIYLFIAQPFFTQTNLSSGLTACYALNGNATDAVNNLNGTLSSVTPAADRFNNSNSALDFNGTAQSYIELPNDPLIKPTQVSFSAWVRFNTVAMSQYIVFAHNGCTSYHEGYTLVLDARVSGAPVFSVVKASAACSPYNQNILLGSVLPVAQSWYHVGMYAGPDSLKVYVNGVLDGVMANSGPLVYNAVSGVYLGGSNVTYNLPLSGTLDNVKFYNRKLTDAEMHQLFVQDQSCDKITGLTEQSLAQVKLYPNPTSGEFTIDLSSNEPAANVTVTNLLGQIIVQQHANNKTLAIHLDDQAKGIYIVKVALGNQVKSYKLIKE